MIFVRTEKCMDFPTAPSEAPEEKALGCEGFDSVRGSAGLRVLFARRAR